MSTSAKARLQCGMIFIAIYLAISVIAVLALGMAAGRTIMPLPTSHLYVSQNSCGDADEPLDGRHQEAEALAADRQHEAFTI